MIRESSNRHLKPVVKGVSYFLAHVPNMVRHGFKPSREIAKAPFLLPSILSYLWTFDKAATYSPNQVFIGNLDPDNLLDISTPSWELLLLIVPNFMLKQSLTATPVG